MTYFGFLGIFLIAPIGVFWGLNLRDRLQGKRLPENLQGLPAPLLTGLLVIIAVVWTTPWDNYLVATQVWWYDVSLVSGIVLGWVPLEEYCFFVLQPILTALWTVWIARRLGTTHNHGRAGILPAQGSNQVEAGKMPAPPLNFEIRLWSTVCVLLVAAGMWWPLLASYKPLTYLALELVWALPPIAIQLAFGADLLWQQRKLVVLGIGAPTLYLAGADILAISSGTWTIDPEQSLHHLMLGPLPLEELIFFLLTNTLVVFGLVLGILRASQSRLPRAFRTKTALPDKVEIL